jgi:hypothetical protein
MITTNTITDKQFFVSYTPYQIPANTIPAYTVSDMITYNLEPNDTPVSLEYFVGAESNYVEVFTIRNITTNAALDIEVVIDNRADIWLLEESKQRVTIGPGQSHVFEFRLNRTALSPTSDREEILSTISVVVTNRKENFVLRNTSISPMERKQIASAIIQ